MRKVQFCIQHRPGPGASCAGRGSLELMEAFSAMLQDAGIDAGIETVNCLVRCEQGPNIRLLPDGTCWSRATGQTLGEILDVLRNQDGRPG